MLLSSASSFAIVLPVNEPVLVCVCDRQYVWFPDAPFRLQNATDAVGSTGIASGMLSGSTDATVLLVAQRVFDTTDPDSLLYGHGLSSM